MTLLAIKHQMRQLKPRELSELHSYLIRLRHSTPEWRRATAKKIRAVRAGRFVSAEALDPAAMESTLGRFKTQLKGKSSAAMLDETRGNVALPPSPKASRPR